MLVAIANFPVLRVSAPRAGVGSVPDHGDVGVLSDSCPRSPCLGASVVGLLSDHPISRITRFPDDPSPSLGHPRLA
jgi:hypothetical protein